MSTPAEQLVQAHRRSKLTEYEDLFAFHCRSRRIGHFERNYRFALEIGRRWHFDFAWPKERLALEIEGIVFKRIRGQLVASGRHAHPEGFREDCLKYATAALLGWTVLRFEQSQVKDGTAVDFAIRVLDRARSRGNP